MDVRTVCRRKVIHTFKVNVVMAPEVRAPILHLGATTYFFTKQNGVFFVAVTKHNVNAAMVFEYLYALINIIKGYFGDKFSGDTIQTNFALVYELLDEILDFGYPQTTDVDVLKMFIHTSGGSKMLDKLKRLRKKEKATPQNYSDQVTGVVSWRQPGLKYRKNELFIDVIESVNLVVSANGNDLRADVSGKIVFKAYLSGMPECKLGVNDKLVMDREVSRTRGADPRAAAAAASGIQLDDCKFHQCVRLSKWDTERSVSFIPPDGEFELMSYRITSNINAPFRLFPNITVLGRNRLSANVNLRALFPYNLFATGIVVRIPVPHNTAVCKINVAVGRAKYDASKSAIVWKIRKMQGQTELHFSADVEMHASVTDTKPWVRPPITLDFQVAQFTASNFFVRFLKVTEQSRYTPVKWVRYLTKSATNGGYAHRI